MPRWAMEPTPAEPCVSLSGAFFAASTRSFAVLRGEAWFTSSTTGSRETMMIGCMSPIGS